MQSTQLKCHIPPHFQALDFRLVWQPWAMWASLLVLGPPLLPATLIPILLAAQRAAISLLSGPTLRTSRHSITPSTLTLFHAVSRASAAFTLARAISRDITRRWQPV